MEKLNILQKMALATDKIARVKKDLNVSTGKSSYKAVGEQQVLEAVKPIENEVGIYSYPISRNVIDKDIITSSTSYNGEVKEKTQFFMRLETVYRFVNIEDKEDYIDITTYGDGIDSGDKAPGKAMTYADKYALLKAYKIETGDDPDKDPSEELKKSDKYVNPTQKIGKDLLDTIVKKIEDTETDTIKVLEYYKVSSLEELTLDQGMKLFESLTNKRKQINK